MLGAVEEFFENRPERYSFSYLVAVLLDNNRTFMKDIQQELVELVANGKLLEVRFLGHPYYEWNLEAKIARLEQELVLTREQLKKRETRAL